MKPTIPLPALNAVYFGVAAACAAWCVAVYGLTTSFAIGALITSLVYGSLSIVSVIMLFPRKGDSLQPAASLRPDTQIILRSACLLLPLAYVTYVAGFCLVESTIRTPGGIARLDAFRFLENLLFQKQVCCKNKPPSASERLYLTNTFSPWIKKRWHAQEAAKPYTVVIEFKVLKDGTIQNLQISKSSGDEKCDQSVLAAFDSIAPPLPVDSAVRVSMDYTMEYNPGQDRWPVYRTDAITPAQDKFLFERGKAANYFSDYSRSEKLLLQCLEERRLRFDSGAPELTSVMCELADLYSRMGLISKSESYFDEAITNASVGQKLHRVELVTALSDYADHSFMCSKFEKALGLYKKCFALEPSALNRNAKIRLAETQYAIRDYDEALRNFAEVVRADEHAPPVDDVDVADRERLSLCMQYLSAGHPDLANKLIRSCFAKYYSAKTDQSKDKALSQLSSLLSAYDELPDAKLGMRYKQTVFAELCRRSDPLSGAANFFRSSIALALWKSGDHARATALYDELLSKYGANTKDRAYALYAQAQFLFNINQYSDAERCLDQAQNIRTKLYAPDDQPLINIKLSRVFLLRTQHREKEVVPILYDIASAHPETLSPSMELAYYFEEEGLPQKAFEIIDAAIRKTYKVNPEDDHGERDCLLREAIGLSRKLNDNKRLEGYLNEQYKSELGRVGLASRTQLIQFYLQNNQLAIAEDLANQEVVDTLPKHKEIFSYQAQAVAFLLLSQVKEAQQRHQTAKYYVTRAIETVEPFGRSGVHVSATGLLAQILVKEGDLKSAEELLAKLYERELVDATSPVHGDIVEGFNTTGCMFTVGTPENDKGAKGERPECEFVDPNPEVKVCKRTPKTPVMLSEDWPVAYRFHDDFAYLQAATLEARARILDLKSETKAAADTRALLLANLEKAMNAPTTGSVDYAGVEDLLIQIPESTMQKKLLQQVQKKTSSWGSDDFYDY